MGKFILKLTDEDKRDYYLEWSTVVDAPTTYGCSLEEFREYYQHRYGAQAMEFEFDQRMARVEARGTSSMIDKSADEVISWNRAGAGETCFSKEQIIDWYCHRQEDPTERGKEHDCEEV